MTKPKTLDQLRAEKERAETQLAQEQHKLERLENNSRDKVLHIDQVGLSQTLALTFNQSCFLLKFTEQLDSLLDMVQ